MPNRRRGRNTYVKNVQLNNSPNVNFESTIADGFIPVLGVDRINKNGIQTEIRTKLFNICAMPKYEQKSMEVKQKQHYHLKSFLHLHAGTSI